MKKEETETVLRFDPTDNCWYAWSCVPKHINAMKKKGWMVKSEDPNGIAVFVAPSHGVKFANAKKPQKRSLSEEEKIDLRKRLTATSDTQKLPEN